VWQHDGGRTRLEQATWRGRDRDAEQGRLIQTVVDSFFYKNTYGRRLRKATELEEQEKEATIRQPN
jgi:hypothetical protein